MSYNNMEIVDYMGKISLLDCTLRDGGYVNDWNFGHNNIVSIYERLVESGTDIIEIGFLDSRRQYDYDRSIMPDTDSVQKIYGNLDKGKSQIFGMIDYGTCGIEHIKPCEESYLDGIRVIFKKHNRVPALKFCAELKEMGYMVFAQLVSVTAYTQEELLDLCKLANEAKPDTVSMVDTYGLLHQGGLRKILEFLDNNLNKSISVGYHGHNNFQMAYANCIEVMRYSATTQRNLLVDGTLYGMGKSAGNAPIELIAMRMNEEYGKKYDISQYIEAIDANIMQFYSSATWGYNLFYYLAASNDCHPDYVKQLMNTHSLSVKQINELLGHLEGDKKLLYDEDYMNELYYQYQKREIDDSNDRIILSQKFADNTILLVGPGTSIRDEKDKIRDFIRNRKPLIISINYVPSEISADYIFISNAKRYNQLSTELHKKGSVIIATSNVTPTKGKFEYRLNICNLLDRGSKCPDNSLMMFIKILTFIGIKKVYLAGFDGYSGTEDNYFDEGKEYSFAKGMSEYLNEYMSDFLSCNRDKIEVDFVTDSKYVQR